MLKRMARIRVNEEDRVTFRSENPHVLRRYSVPTPLPGDNVLAGITASQSDDSGATNNPCDAAARRSRGS